MSNEGDLLKIISQDGAEFFIFREDAEHMITIKDLSKDCETSTDLPVHLPKILKKDLEKVLFFLRAFKEPKDGWEDHFYEEHFGTGPDDIGNSQGITDLMFAALYLNFEALLDSTTTCIARLCLRLDNNGIAKKIFDVENNVTPKEIEEARKNTPWLNDPSTDFNEL